MQNFLRQGGVQTKETNIYSLGLLINLDQKSVWNKAFLSHQMQIFLRQAVVQPPNHYVYLYI